MDTARELTWMSTLRGFLKSRNMLVDSSSLSPLSTANCGNRNENNKQYASVNDVSLVRRSKAAICAASVFFIDNSKKGRSRALAISLVTMPAGSGGGALTKLVAEVERGTLGDFCGVGEGRRNGDVVGRRPRGLTGSFQRLTGFL